MVYAVSTAVVSSGSGTSKGGRHNRVPDYTGDAAGLVRARALGIALTYYVAFDRAEGGNC